VQVEADEVPAALLIGLYGTIALSLIVLLVYRLCVNCGGWGEDVYEVVAEVTDDGGVGDGIISPLSLYCYQPMETGAPSSYTPRSTSSSPLSSSYPSLQTSYVSTDDEEDGQRATTLLAYSV
jgi:hypothetical protein